MGYSFVIALALILFVNILYMFKNQIRRLLTKRIRKAIVLKRQATTRDTLALYLQNAAVTKLLDKDDGSDESVDLDEEDQKRGIKSYGPKRTNTNSKSRFTPSEMGRFGAH